MLPNHVFARIKSDLNENKRLYGKELNVKPFPVDSKNFSGRITYQLPNSEWQVEVLYRDKKSISESARPKAPNVKKRVITESEANVFADMLFPKKDRGPYRKQIKNANFVSHFFEYGLVSYEMQLDSRRIFHKGIMGIRAVLYSNGDTFNKIKVNAYQ